MTLLLVAVTLIAAAAGLALWTVSPLAAAAGVCTVLGLAAGAAGVLFVNVDDPEGG